MYKVFFNKVLIQLAHPTEVSGKSVHLIKGDENLFELIAKTSSSKNKKLRLVGDDYDKLLAWFKSHFHRIVAAGGVVKNEHGKFLVIFRRGMWDLPKGKLDKGEKKKQCAMREVTEETGVKPLIIQKKLDKTYHVHFQNKVPCLKVTYWYLMETDHIGKLVPQSKEDIEEAKWVSKKELRALKPLMYKSLHHIVDDVAGIA